MIQLSWALNIVQSNHIICEITTQAALDTHTDTKELNACIIILQATVVLIDVVLVKQITSLEAFTSAMFESFHQLPFQFHPSKQH